ncbi:hypothetical protein FQZ97_1215790 [compost metagenome]
MQAVRGGIAPVGHIGIGLAQLGLEALEQGRNLVIELGARQGVARGQGAVDLHRMAPGGHDGITAQCQVVRQRGESVIGL